MVHGTFPQERLCNDTVSGYVGAKSDPRGCCILHDVSRRSPTIHYQETRDRLEGVCGTVDRGRRGRIGRLGEQYLGWT